MLSVRPAKRFAAALLLPLAMMAGVVSGAELLLCQMDGVVRSSCCCPHEVARQANAPVIEQSGCCEGLSLEVLPAPSMEQRSLHMEQPALAIVVSSPGAARSALVESEIDARPLDEGDPRRTTGPPLFLLHRALLI